MVKSQGSCRYFYAGSPTSRNYNFFMPGALFMKTTALYLSGFMAVYKRRMNSKPVVVTQPEV